MSMDVDVRIYDAVKLIKKIVENIDLEGISDRSDDGVTSLVTAILESFGTFLDDGKIYILLNNEHAREFNPYFNIKHVLNAAFGKPITIEGQEFRNDWFDFFLDHKREYSEDGISCVDKNMIMEDLGIESRENEDEDE